MTRAIKGKGFRTDRLSLKVRQIIRTHGDAEIIGMVISRTPVLDLWRRLFNVLTFGEFQQRLNMTSYDELFHLRIDVELEDFSIIGIEKLDIINMDRDPKVYDTTEEQNVFKIPKGLTIKSIMDNTESYMGPKFYTYSAVNNNCQDFIKAILISNNIGDNNDLQFVKQDLKSLFKDLNFLRKFANTATDISAYIKMLIDNVRMSNNDQVELMKLQKKTDLNHIEGEGMISEDELETRIKSILARILLDKKDITTKRVIKEPKKRTVKEPKKRTVKEPKVKPKAMTKVKVPKVRTAEQIRLDKERMAKLRAMRKKK